MILYHGSSEIVQKPVFGQGKTYNDYGLGFYCTEHMELAKEWACRERKTGFVSGYELDMGNLKILNLSDREYSILHWLAILLENRRIRLSTPVMKRGFEWLKRYYSVETDEYDVMTGYRADDSYFAFARAFVNNEISRLYSRSEYCLLWKAKAEGRAGKERISEAFGEGREGRLIYQGSDEEGRCDWT